MGETRPGVCAKPARTQARATQGHRMRTAVFRMIFPPAAGFLARALDRPVWAQAGRGMAADKRIADDPAFVLHSYDWSESSLILEVFCRHQGRVALVAKGAKKPSSNFRPVLLPLPTL